MELFDFQTLRDKKQAIRGLVNKKIKLFQIQREKLWCLWEKLRVLRVPELS
jgi:hypothetical protein